MKKIPAGTRAAIPVLLFITAISFTLTDCRTNPATGKQQLNLISEDQEIQIGKESDQQIVGSMGIYENGEIQSYVDTLGKNLAATSERPNLPWTFRVIDDPTVNAFALPGGFIYVTRGILTHLNNESQLAGVIGHEIGHVTAAHGPNQLSKQQLSSFGLGVAMVLSPGLRQFAPLASLGLQLMFLKFSRDDELQADELGVRYMARLDEDPRALINVMEMLNRVSRNGSSGRLPEWLSTHPNPENREERIAEAIRELDLPDDGTLGSGAESNYLERLDGMVYGADPKEGFTQEGIFYHPGLKFRIDFPSGWQVINQKNAVIAIDSEQASAIQLSLSEAPSPNEAMRSLFAQEGISGDGGRNTRINGLPASTAEFTARTEQGVLAGRATFIEYQDRVYQLVGYAAAQNWQAFSEPVRQSTFSFMELTEPRFLNVQPLRLEIVRLDSAMTVREFADRYPSPAVTIEELALINQVEPDAVLGAGDLIKRVVGDKFSF